MQSSAKKVALIVGAGNNTGSAIAKAFAKLNLSVCVVRRNAERLNPLIKEKRDAGGTAYGFGVDFRKEKDVIECVAEIEQKIGCIDVAVYNIGGNVRFPIVDTTTRVYSKVWEMACFSGFLMGRQVASVMVQKSHGTIWFTGATASSRGSSGFSAFAGAKHGLRALAQSMAKELGPKGIHVGHILIDGAIDTPWNHENYPLAKQKKEVDGLLQPKDIASNYVHLYKQPRNAWTFELDLRP